MNDIGQRYPAPELGGVVLDHLGEGVIVYDAALRYVVFNSFMERLTGTRSEEVLGRFAPEVFPFLRTLGMEAAMRRALSGEEVTLPEVMVRMPRTNREIWELPRYKPQRDGSGRIVGVLALVTDVTERKQTEAELRAAMVELAELRGGERVQPVHAPVHAGVQVRPIIGESAQVQEALRQVQLVAPTEATVLISGETGTGKELFARAVHELSQRRSRPLIKVNCAAISANLVESELFGHVRGAFTGAVQARAGRFELADQGTIFLDEVGELPLEIQAKLLRFLQEHEFEAVGSSTTRYSDVRVIGATNRNLEQAVAAGRFREDLYYRLNVFPIALPPLRERRTDVPLLVRTHLAELAVRLRRPVQELTAQSMDYLLAHDWPGNVRELHNVLERAAIASSGPVLEIPPLSQARHLPPGPTPRSERLMDVERMHIQSVLARSHGVIEGPDGAARLLGLQPSTLRSRMVKLGIVRQRGGSATKYRG